MGGVIPESHDDIHNVAVLLLLNTYTIRSYI